MASHPRHPPPFFAWHVDSPRQRLDNLQAVVWPTSLSTHSRLWDPSVWRPGHASICRLNHQPPSAAFQTLEEARRRRRRLAISIPFTSPTHFQPQGVDLNLLTIYSIRRPSGQVSGRDLAMNSSASTWMLPFIFIVPLFFGFAKPQTAYESLYTLTAFSEQQDCVQHCFTGGYSNIDCFSDVLGSAIGCPNSPCSKTWQAVDECYCRGDLQSAAYDWLSSCIGEACTIGDTAVNLANAASIYSGYCTQRGFTALPAQNTATTTSPNGDSTHSTANTGSGTTSSAPSTGSPNDSSSSRTPSPSSTNTTTLTIALAAVGAVAGIAILLAGVAFWKIRQKKNNVYHGPVSLTPWLDSPSAQKLSASGGPATEIDVYPNESASQVGAPTHIGPSYPHYPVPPSVLSSNRPGYNQSTVGPGLHYGRY